MKKREGLRKIITLVLAMVCVASCTSLLFTGLSFKGFAQTSENANFIGYTCSGDLYSETNTFAYNAVDGTYNVSEQGAIPNAVVTEGNASITVLTHGLSGSALHWSNKNGKFAPKDYSIIAKLSQAYYNRTGKTANVYWAKMESATSFKLIPLIQSNVDEEGIYDDEGSAVQYIQDATKHIIIVFESSGVASNGSNQQVYSEFNYMLSKIVYDVKCLNNGVLPKVNLIGHSRGGITNLQYALDHPALVESMYAIGTPFFGSSSAATMFGEMFTEGVGREDIINRQLYSSYYERWNAGFTSYYSNINVHALGGYSDTNFVFDRLIEDNNIVEDYIKDGELKVVKWVVANYFGIAGTVTLAAKIANEIATWFRTDDYSESEWEALLLEFLSEISYIDENSGFLANLKGLIPFVGCPVLKNDLLVNLSSQLGYDEYSQADREYNFNRYVKKFDEENCNLARIADTSMPAIVHNLEPQDADIINYIVSRVVMDGFEENYLYNYVEGDDNDIIITGIKDLASTAQLTIPTTINDKPVTEIAYGAFSGLNLSSVTVPNTVTKIGGYAFANNQNLTTVTFEDGSGLIDLNEGVFSGCIALTGFWMPDSIKTIKDGAFNGCEGLKFMHIPQMVELISSTAFLGCKRITSFHVDAANPYFYSRGNDLYIGTNDVNSNTLLRYAPAKRGTSFTIPKDVERIAEYAFEGASNLTHVNLNVVKYISSNAFMGCENLADISGGEQITHVAKNAFEDTVWYANRTYDENGFLVLGQVLLEYAGSATKITLDMFPENVKYIADSAFYSDTLEKIAIPNYVGSIGSMAFFDCENLTAIYMQRAVCPQIVGGVIATSDVQIYVPKNSLSSYQDWLVHDNISVGVTAVYLETQGEDWGWIELACGDVLPDFIQPPNDWYKFLGWEDVNTGKLYQTYDVIDFLWEDAKLVAQWELIIHNIYYTIEGGVNHPSNPTVYSAENQDIVVYDPIVDEGKTFEGWYLDEWYNAPYTSGIFGSCFGGVMLFAKISNAQYNITFVSEGTQVDPQTVTYGVVNDFPVSEREDYSFQGWYTDDGKKVATAEGFGVAKWDIPNHTTLEARWLRKYFVVAEVNGQLAWLGSEDFVGEQTSIDYGTKFNCPVCCMTLSFMRSDERIIEGHVFKGFSASENGELLDCWGATVPAIEEILSRQYTEGVNAYKIYPVYEKEVYSVVIDRADGSVATEARVQFDAEVPYPTDISEAEINPGYNFLRWKISAYGISTFEINDLFNFERMPDISYNYEGWGSITISACWEANEYTVRLICGDGVVMNDEKAVYDSESNVFSVPNKAGYRFLGWYDSDNVKYADELGRATRKWDKNYDSELFAKFEIINYTVNFVDEKFYITTNPMNYNIETGIYELPQIEQLGYIFNGWAENGTVINQISTGRTGDINLVATWIGEEFKAHETTSTLISSGNYSGTTAVIINLENLSSTTDRTYTIDSSVRQVSFFGISGVQYKINLIVDTRNQDLTLNLKDVAFSKDANIIYAQSNVPLTIKSYGQSGLFAENRKNAMLLLNSSVNIYVKDSLTIIGGSSEQELFAGSVAIKVKDLSVYLEQQALLTVKGGDGIDGSNGEDGTVGAIGASVSSPCENGYPGGDGGAGTAGIRGSSGADAIVLSGNFYIHGNGSLILQGGNGGSGGNGGTGGTGGEGTIGGAAGFLNTAGTGGNGGTGGIGGAGGTGGKGGLPFSGALEVSNNGVNLVFAIGNCGTGGNGGNGGTGGKAGGGGLNTALGNDGEGGNGGNGGTGGKGGDAYSVTFTCEELNIHLSQQGAVGSGGTGGVGGERGLGGHNKVELAGNNGQTGVSGTDGNIIS